MITNNNSISEKSIVLFINDSKTDLLVMNALLNKNFYIINVLNTNEALNLIDEIKVDIIIYNGLFNNDIKQRVQILKKIDFVDKYSNIKIFALLQDEKARHQFIKQGFDEAFSKPVLKEEIFAAL